PVAGTIVEILFEEDDTVDVGDVIVRIGDPDAVQEETKPEPEPEAKSEPEPEAKSEPEPEPEAKPEPKAEAKPQAQPAAQSESKSQPKEATGSTKVNTDGVPYVTPLVRKLADKHGIELSTLTGTGVGGRIRKQDVIKAAEEKNAPQKAAPAADTSKAPAAPEATGPRARWSTVAVDPEKQDLIGTTKKVNRIREITAKKMVEALQTAAQLTHLQEVDVTAIAQLRKAKKPQFQDKHGVNLTYLPFFVKATVEALVSHPNVNASYNPETKEMTYHEDVNIAIAVDTPRGLLTPVIHKAQDLSLPEIAQQIADLADRARNNKLKPQDLTGATFTITNIGSAGALSDTPILVPPQAGILGTAAIQKRPVVISANGSDAIAIRQMCYIPFTYDHQVVDGADAGRFTQTIKDRLETGNFEADLEL
ncbi:2-oxoglutarate dehydrogenase, E2 component, dihydrolipoamide succinyltransferase, partial [Corynebacterium sp. ES2715-CONJ3]|uniref:2-oxoglutarate dehydrogenase, E2 component, dihydrolipoamide succinyltransferase n=1 Tax=Corynebacterium sp. ES2715-CONJ3 TaxID=2974028 RepID=UPI002169CD78